MTQRDRATKRETIGTETCSLCSRGAGRNGRRSSPPPPKVDVKRAASCRRRRVGKAEAQERE